jgi:hypothetical protein
MGIQVVWVQGKSGGLPALEPGVQRLFASCLNDACRHQGLTDVSGCPADTEAPWFRLRVKCAKCGGRGNKIDVRPNGKNSHRARA